MKKCKDVMTRDPVCCVPGDTVSRLAQVMKTEDVGPVPIVDDRSTKKLRGIVTDRDLAMQVVAEERDPSRVMADDVMSPDPVTCRPDDDLDTALDAMKKHQVRRILVVDDDGTLVGIIAQADVALRSGEREKTADLVAAVSKPRARPAARAA
jgi:CBS domain-containing protein